MRHLIYGNKLCREFFLKKKEGMPRLVRIIFLVLENNMKLVL